MSEQRGDSVRWTEMLYGFLARQPIVDHHTRALSRWRLIENGIACGHGGSQHFTTHRHTMVASWIAADAAVKVARVNRYRYCSRAAGLLEHRL